MPQLPSEARIRSVAESLGHGPGPYPTKLKAQLVKTIQLSQEMAAEEAQATTDVDKFVALAESIRIKLRPTFSSQGCEEIVAALAPTIYREAKDRTPQK